jgi:hypothetical protein
MGKAQTNDASKRRKSRSNKGASGYVVRDSFTMPVIDYGRIPALKARCIALGVAMKKSELLRAGLLTLEHLPDADLKRVIAMVENVKTGRPPGKKARTKKG